MTGYAYALTWDVPTEVEPTAQQVQPSVSPPTWPDWVTYPVIRPRSAPEPQRQTKEILDWAGISLRMLAEFLGTTHPTLSALASGEATNFERRPEIKQHLRDLHALCERLAPLVDYNAAALRMLLLRDDGHGQRVGDVAGVGGDPATAYLQALRALSPRPESDFAVSVFPAVPGEATVALHD